MGCGGSIAAQVPIGQRCVMRSRKCHSCEHFYIPKPVRDWLSSGKVRTCNLPKQGGCNRGSTNSPTLDADPLCNHDRTAKLLVIERPEAVAHGNRPNFRKQTNHAGLFLLSTALCIRSNTLPVARKLISANCPIINRMTDTKCVPLLCFKRMTRPILCRRISWTS